LKCPELTGSESLGVFTSETFKQIFCRHCRALLEPKRNVVLRGLKGVFSSAPIPGLREGPRCVARTSPARHSRGSRARNWARVSRGASAARWAGPGCDVGPRPWVGGRAVRGGGGGTPKELARIRGKCGPVEFRSSSIREMSRTWTASYRGSSRPTSCRGRPGARRRARVREKWSR
jgi:hypothetical protein